MNGFGVFLLEGEVIEFGGILEIDSLVEVGVSEAVIKGLTIGLEEFTSGNFINEEMFGC
jgi:hypothetical protein